MKFRDRIAKIQQNRTGAVRHPNDITNKLPEYCVIQYSKFHFLDQAFAHNPFSTTHMVWIDAGLSRFYDATNKYRLTRSTSLFAIQADFVPPLDLHFDSYVESNMCILHGGLWVIGSKQALHNTVASVEEIWVRMMQEGRLDNEQIALALSYINSPEYYELIVVRGNRAIFEHFFAPVDKL